MKNSLIKYLVLIANLWLLAQIPVGCTSGYSDEPSVANPIPQIIVMYAPGGLGDQGYNDCILTGVQSFKKKHYSEVEMYQYSPGTLEEAERLLSDWLSLPESKIPALFVVGSNDYEGLVAEVLRDKALTSNKRLLLFESDNDDNLPITTFRLSMYGASYLAGVTAAQLLENGKNALILLAHKGDSTIEKAETGFRDGFKDSGARGEALTEYLADDWTGYVSAQLAYQRMSDWSRNYGYIFPVAGGSNQGIYRFTREHQPSPLTAGMDIDQSGLSRNIAGSVIKHIDKVVFYFMETWLSTGELPDSEVFGLESGYTDWKLSPYFAKYQSAIDEMYLEAKRKEAEEL